MSDIGEDIAKQILIEVPGESNPINAFVAGVSEGHSVKNEIEYSDPKKAAVMETPSPTTPANPNSAPAPKASSPVDTKKWDIDIAQSHHFTVELSGIQSFSTPGGSFSNFLPVKNIQIAHTSYENMNIPVAIFGDFPILSRKRVSTIQITCQDRDDDIIERQLRAWKSSCFPQGKYVAYMSNITKKLTYRSYDVKGKENKAAKVEVSVIPTGNLSVTRDYSDNGAKLINFSVVCVE